MKSCKWLSDETIRIAEQRKAAKAAGKREESRKLNSDFQRAVRKDNEVYWGQRCKQLEEDYMKGHTRNAFAQVKRIRTPFVARKGIIKNKEGKVLEDQQGIKNRWQEYAEELYTGSNKAEPEDYFEGEVEIEPAILEEEVSWAMRQLPDNKAPGIDTIPAELLKPVPAATIKVLC
ncbi:hypothetical protein JGC83_24640, partial [Salmonella enterica subsp. enterica serovar Derby]|nr:hypothetical protein [Salmonella enterica subsp. enterica serovar Derby]